MKKKVILIVVAVVLLLAILLGVLPTRTSGPVVVERSYDAPIPRVMKNSGAELSVDGLYEFSLEGNNYLVSYMDDDFLIFYSSEPMEMDGYLFSSVGYYLYTFETKEVQPIVAAGWRSGYRITGDPGFVREGDKIYFHLTQANQTQHFNGENRYYSFDCVTGELMLLDTDETDSYFRGKVTHDGKVYSLNRNTSLLDTLSRTYVQEFDPETGKLSNVHKELSVLPFSTGKTLLKIGFFEDTFQLLVQDAKTGIYYVEFYDTAWKLLRTASLENFAMDFSPNTATFWKNFLLNSVDSTLYCIDLSSDSLSFERFSNRACAQISGDSPDLLLLFPQVSYTSTPTTELLALTPDGTVIKYDFDPFGWGDFKFHGVLQSGDHIMFLYFSSKDFRNVYTDLATLESYQKK